MSETKRDKYGMIMTNIVNIMTNIVTLWHRFYFHECKMLFISTLGEVRIGTKLANIKMTSIIQSLSD